MFEDSDKEVVVEVVVVDVVVTDVVVLGVVDVVLGVVEVIIVVGVIGVVEVDFGKLVVVEHPLIVWIKERKNRKRNIIITMHKFDYVSF